jgi:hypothetical protein
MTQKKTDEIIKGLQEEVARLTALIEQLKSEIHTFRMVRRCEMSRYEDKYLFP